MYNLTSKLWERERERERAYFQELESLEFTKFYFSPLIPWNYFNRKLKLRGCQNMTVY